MVCTKLIFREHALLRMVARRITRFEIEAVLAEGCIIAEYPTDKPFPSKLLLGSVRGRSLHIVVAQDEAEHCYIVTAYEPDPLIWDNDFTLKKKL